MLAATQKSIKKGDPVNLGLGRARQKERKSYVFPFTVVLDQDDTCVVEP